MNKIFTNMITEPTAYVVTLKPVPGRPAEEARGRVALDAGTTGNERTGAGGGWSMTEVGNGTGFRWRATAGISFARQSWEHGVCR